MISFSVVIPLYNKEKEIVQTIHSVLAQSHKADEIIIVDDGSTDESVKILKPFRDKIILVSQENQGVSAARNKGMQTATNEFICFLDGDDTWEPDFLKEIALLITQFPQALFYSTAHDKIDETGRRTENTNKTKIPKRYIISNFTKAFSKNYALINASSVCVRKSSAVIFPTNEKKGEDLCVWLQLSLKGNLAHSSRILSTYRLDASNRSHTVHKQTIIPCPIKWFYQNKEELTSHVHYRDIKKFIYTNLFITVYGGFALNQDYRSIQQIAKLMKQHHDLRYLLLYPAYLIPVPLLNMIKNIRRKRQQV